MYEPMNEGERISKYVERERNSKVIEKGNMEAVLAALELEAVVDDVVMRRDKERLML